MCRKEIDTLEPVGVGTVVAGRRVRLSRPEVNRTGEQRRQDVVLENGGETDWV